MSPTASKLCAARNHLRVGVALLAGACGGAPTAAQLPVARTSTAPLSSAADDRMIEIPAGRYIKGSTPEERGTSYDDYQRTAGDDSARTERRFESELDRTVGELPAFRIDLMPVTNAQYGELVAAEPAAAPVIDDAGWHAQGLPQDFATQVARFVWRNGRPPDGREDHPVVLVRWDDAARYCAWRGQQVGAPRRLPTADEYEKASRGAGGMSYPWGNAFEPDKLNSAIHGPGDTTPVGTYTAGASPYGVLDLAGNVMQWTATPGEADGGKAMLVKGSSWGDVGGLGRGAARELRAKTLRHVVIGFRCAG